MRNDADKAAEIMADITNGDQSWRDTLSARAMAFLEANALSDRQANALCVGGDPKIVDEIERNAQLCEAKVADLKAGKPLSEVWDRSPEDIEFIIRVRTPTFATLQMVVDSEAETINQPDAGRSPAQQEA